MWLTCISLETSTYNISLIAFFFGMPFYPPTTLVGGRVSLAFSSSKNSIIYTLHSHWHMLTSFNLIGHLCSVRPLTLIFFVNVKIIFFIFLIGSINVCTITWMVFGGHVMSNGFKIGVLSKCTWNMKVETYETCSEHKPVKRESTWLQWPSNLFLLQYNSAF